ncbi:hypothetical protein CYMTET_7529 [Cymbomonas tetramitiformis]|uniref:Sulfotransferase n=1 Tax=Cymbomonas tetramitiformis TaxID=36881 RepID=A0AAE0LGX7_9CHLO|nr:hypothetical protein CYMTET_7529 [Cymbomonas tetramitiformis]
MGQKRKQTEDDVPHSYPAVLVDGTPSPPFITQEAFNNACERYEAQETDIFVCTYPKCGTTWLQQILQLVLNKNDPKDDKQCSDAIPWLEASFGPKLGPGGRHDPEKLLTSAPYGLRAYKTHASYSQLQRLFLKGAELGRRPRTVYVARNPKDCAVSLYHHARSKTEWSYTGDWKHFVEELFFTGKVESGSWFEHTSEFWKRSQNPEEKILFLKYEDLLVAPENEVRKLLTFLGLELDDEQVTQVVTSSSFAAMKQSYKEPPANEGETPHIRQGTSGGWRSYFTVEQNEVLEFMYEKYIQRHGLVFDFGKGDVH